MPLLIGRMNRSEYGTLSQDLVAEIIPRISKELNRPRPSLIDLESGTGNKPGVV